MFNWHHSHYIYSPIIYRIESVLATQVVQMTPQPGRQARVTFYHSWIQMEELEQNCLFNVCGLYTHNGLFGYTTLLVVLTQVSNTVFYDKNYLGIYY